jgi:cell division protein FtsL
MRDIKLHAITSNEKRFKNNLINKKLIITDKFIFKLKTAIPQSEVSPVYKTHQIRVAIEKWQHF